MAQQPAMTMARQPAISNGTAANIVNGMAWICLPINYCTPLIRNPCLKFGHIAVPLILLNNFQKPLGIAGHHAIIILLAAVPLDFAGRCAMIIAGRRATRYYWPPCSFGISGRRAIRY